MTKSPILAAALVAALAIPAGASPAVTVTSPIWSQTVAFTMPGGFVTNYEKTTGNHYQREAVPKGEAGNGWTQMITVTGERNLTKSPGITPKTFAEKMAGGFKQACPDSFSAQAIGSGTISGYPSYTAIMSCGTSPTTNGTTSESAIMLIVAGKKDYYTLQYAVRTPVSATPLHLDVAAWKARLAKLAPVEVI